MSAPRGSAPALGPRGTTECRGCGRLGLESVLDLGDQPLANDLPRTADEDEPAYPLHLRICASCGLGQVGEYIPPDRIFRADYPYQSSVSASWVAHAGAFVDAVVAELGLGADDLVVEVASNDGYLLTQVQERGVDVLGIEPAGGVADLARSRGVPTLSAFLGRQVAQQVREKHGIPRLVVANNVMAHVPDLDDFVGGLATLCGGDTVITVENPSLVTLVAGTQFDTIYHEHFSYLTAHAVRTIVEPHGLELVRVERLATHGGSNRYWLRRRGSAPVEASVGTAIEEELAAGLLDPEAWVAFRDACRAAVGGLRTWLATAAADGRRVAGYGAAAKGNTLLNAAGTTCEQLLAVADGSPAKQGRHLPGSRVPVVAPEGLADLAVDAVLLLPWNIADELSPLVGRLAPGAEHWVAIPTLRRVGP